MFYTLLEDVPSKKIVTKLKSFQFKFNYKNIWFLDETFLPENINKVFTLYNLEHIDLEPLHTEYSSWCEKNSITGNAELLAKTTFEYWKQLKYSKLEQETDLFEQSKNNDMYFTSSLGFRVNGDRRSLTNITSLIEYFDVKQQDGTIGFKDYDNTIDKVTKEQLQTIKAELVTNSENLYAQKWALQDAINNAETLDDLNAIKIEFTMMDFTPKTEAQTTNEEIAQTIASLFN